MSSCSCCQWCAEFCCPGLKGAHRTSPYPHIQYSPVVVEKSSNKEGTSRSHDDQVLESHPALHPELVFSFMQDKLQFNIHPQLGVCVENESITEQPSTRRFMQRFSLVNAGSTTQFKMTNHTSTLRSVPTLPVYREKTLNPNELDIKDPVVQFSLHYDVQQSVLRVHLQRVSNLSVKFCKGMPAQCDPFVILHLVPYREDTFQTQTIRCTHDPIFNQFFQFRGVAVDDIRLQTLVFQIYNHASNSESIGKAHLPLADAELFGAVMQLKIIDTNCEHFETKNESQGDLLISLSFDPQAHILDGMICKATGLKKQDLLGKADPYVKVYIAYKNNKVFKWKSSVKLNTLLPVYNESFSYKFTDEMNMDDITLSFYTVNLDRFSWNDIIGVSTIGQSVNSKLGKKHWTEVMQYPRQRISYWHSIQLATAAQKRYMRSRSNSPVPQH